MKLKQSTDRQAGFGALGVIAIITIVGLIAALIWVFITRTVPATTTNSSSVSAQTKTVTLQPSDITAKIKSQLAASYTIVASSDSAGLQANEASVNISSSSPPYKVQGADYYVTYGGGSTIYTGFIQNQDYSVSANDTKLRTDIAKIYSDNKLTLVNDALTDNTYDHYEGNGLTCTVHKPSAVDLGTTSSCGLISSYAPALAALKPILASLPQNTNDLSTTIYNAPKITTSETPGYKTAEVGAGDIRGAGASLLFYKNDSGSWKYFKAVQNLLLCSEYSTTELKAAYKGQSCYATNDTDIKSTVE